MKTQISYMIASISAVLNLTGFAAESLIVCDGVKLLTDENPSAYEDIDTKFSIYEDGTVDMSIEGDKVEGFKVVKTLSETNPEILEQTVEVLRIYGISNITVASINSRTEYLMKKEASLHSPHDTWTSAVIVELKSGKSYVLTMVGAMYGLCAQTR